MPRRTSRSSADDTARARKRHAELFVEVTSVNLRTAPIADVASLEALVEIGKKYETMILELPHGDDAEYLLWDGGMVFRYRTPDYGSAARGAVGDKSHRADDYPPTG